MGVQRWERKEAEVMKGFWMMCCVMPRAGQRMLRTEVRSVSTACFLWAGTRSRFGVGGGSVLS